MQEPKTKDAAYNVISESSALFYIFYLNHTADRVRIGKQIYATISYNGEDKTYQITKLTS
jgi:hypothetical protein